MNTRTQVHTVDQRDKHFGVTTRACPAAEPPFVVYQGATVAQSVALFFDKGEAEDYVKWRNAHTETVNAP